MVEFECQKVALKQDATGYILTLRIQPDDIPIQLLRDYVSALYTCKLQRIDREEIILPQYDRVKRAGMLCRSKDFYDWLQIDGTPEAKEALAAQFIYNYCGIVSRAELATKQDAKIQFDKMVNEYDSREEVPF